MMEWSNLEKVNGFLTTPLIPDGPHVTAMECPKCNSEKTNMINITFPKTLECNSCGHIFLESRKTFIDE